MLPRRLVALSVPLIAAVTIVGGCGGGDTSGDAGDTTVAVDTSAGDTSADDSSAGGTSPSSADDTGAKPDVDIPDEIPTELVVTVLQPGDGAEAAEGDTVVVDYVGVLSDDGTEFDNSYDRGTPFPVTLGSGSVIEGWDQGLRGVQAGSRIQLDIPGDLAYGEQGSGDAIGPNAALTFVIDVRQVIGAINSADAPTDVDLPDDLDVDTVTVDDLVTGDGDAVTAGRTAWINYIAYAGDGTVLESSWEAGRPVAFPVDTANTAVPGLVEGVTGMQTGGRRLIVIPADQAFGGAGNEQLGLTPGQPLIMVVDIVAIS